MPVELNDPDESPLSSHHLANGRFQLTRTLGVGGMATVYAVEDVRLGVQRAVKVLNPALSEQLQVRTRFIAEARTMASLEHSNIVRVYDVDLDGESPYIVMELLDGGSLVDWLRDNGPMPPRLAVDVLIEILTALQVAHRGGVIHRDIKPHNVLLTASGDVKVTDFGIARSTQPDQDAELTRTGTIMGTWAFMAPEQRTDAKNVDPRADLYATGATLCALVTDRTPSDLFAADLDSGILSDVPSVLHAFIKKATRYRREDRFADVDEMLQAAVALREQLPSLPRETAPLSGVRSSTIIPPLSAPPSLGGSPENPRQSQQRITDQTFAVDSLEDGFSTDGLRSPSKGEPQPARPQRSAVLAPMIIGGLGLLAVALLTLVASEQPALAPVQQESPAQSSLENIPLIDAGETAEPSIEAGLTEGPSTAPEATPAEGKQPAVTHIQYKVIDGRVPTVQAWVEGGPGYDQLTLLWRTSPNEAWQETKMNARNAHFVAPLTPDKRVQFFITARSSSLTGRTLRIGSAGSPMSL
jgi:serine/threonine-protein kinase